MPELEGLFVADPPERWEALGFAVYEGQISLGAVRLVLGGAGRGITAWTLDAVDGLASAPLPPVVGACVVHPNGAVGLDHFVVATPSFDATAASLAAAGMELRRVVEMRGRRMGFRRVGSAILELVEAPGPGEAAAFWGLTVTVLDLDAVAALLGDRLGSIRPAVQPGRRIATVRASAGLSTNMAFMDLGVAEKAET